MNSCFFQVHLCELECKKQRSGFDLELPIPFTARITVTLSVLLIVKIVVNSRVRSEVFVFKFTIIDTIYAVSSLSNIADV